MFRTISVILFFSLLSANSSALESLPDDIRYMLEDLYGANKSKWPVTRKTDLNKDGFSDWVAKKENCADKKKCPVEIFICIPDIQGKCSEYCYVEIETLKNIEERLPDIKCESTC